MQNKGFIRVVAVLLTLICLFYLSFSVVTAIYNNKAKEYAAGDEAKYKHYIDSISTEKVAPNIQKLEKDGLILIELPGIKEPERVRKLLQGSANLEFWETYKLEQLAPKLDAVNNAIAAANAAQEPAEEEAPVVAEATPDTAAVAADSTASSLKKKLQQEASEAETMERIRKQNPLLSLMNYTQSYGGSPVIGIVNKNDTAAVNAMLASKIARDILPSDRKSHR